MTISRYSSCEQILYVDLPSFYQPDSAERVIPTVSITPISRAPLYAFLACMSIRLAFPDPPISLGRVAWSWPNLLNIIFPLLFFDFFNHWYYCSRPTRDRSHIYHIRFTPGVFSRHARAFLSTIINSTHTHYLFFILFYFISGSNRPLTPPPSISTRTCFRAARHSSVLYEFVRGGQVKQLTGRADYRIRAFVRFHKKREKHASPVPC